MKNGAHFNGPMIGGRPQVPTVKVDFNEMLFRGIAAQVKADAERQGGAFPMPDPAGFLAFVLVMDKLNAITERLDKIETAIAQPNTPA